jgi:hypothetical protein
MSARRRRSAMVVHPENPLPARAARVLVARR